VPAFVLSAQSLRRSLLTGAVVSGLLSCSSGVLAQAHPLDAAAGKALFERNWIPAPASTAASDGLGPFYNARACSTCHPAGGRGSTLQALTLRSDDPVYGKQLQPLALAGMEPELRYTLAWLPARRPLAEGSSVPLQQLQVELDGLRYGPLQSGWSARLAPGLHGLALLESVPEAAILALADPDDADGDGISGRPSWVKDGSGERRLGRFGWKAELPDLALQTAQAFSLDLGLGTPLLPSSYGDCSSAQQDCLQQVPGTVTGPDATELGEGLFELVLAYLRSLPAPAPLAARTAGAVLFESSGCAACHRPVLPAADGSQLQAYTDLLLPPANGARRRCGASPAPSATCMTAVPPAWKKPFSGTAARRRRQLPPTVCCRRCSDSSCSTFFRAYN
jgi:CxxC motif-containing protein (DUF1111 family)